MSSPTELNFRRFAGWDNSVGLIVMPIFSGSEAHGGAAREDKTSILERSDSAHHQGGGDAETPFMHAVVTLIGEGGERNDWFPFFKECIYG